MVNLPQDLQLDALPSMEELELPDKNKTDVQYFFPLL